MTKVELISGFLGAGKTTLIQKLIQDVFKGKNVVLVENEFGEIGIDGSFLKEAGIQINEINSGCICCTLQGDFHVALQQLQDTYHPDYILIEPSGVGKLSEIVPIIEEVEGLEIHSKTTVVDIKRLQTYHKNFKEFFDDQIQEANTIIMSRTQQVDDQKIQDGFHLLKQLNPHAHIITTPWDQIDGQEIYQVMIDQIDFFKEEEHCCCHHDEEECCHHEHHHHDEEECCHHKHHHHEEEECCHHEHHHHDEEECCHHEHHHHNEEECCHHEHHHHDEEHAHQLEEVLKKEAMANDGLSDGNRIIIAKDDHDHHHHHHHHGHDANEVFTSIGIETIQKYTKQDILNALSRLPETIIRAKGIVPSTQGDWLFFDYTGGDSDVRPGQPAYTGLITIIGRDVDIDQMKELFGIH